MSNSTLSLNKTWFQSVKLEKALSYVSSGGFQVKNLGPKKSFGLKKLLVKENFCPKIFLGPIKILGSKIDFVSEKNFASEKIFVWKTFEFKKKLLVWKNFGSENFEFKKKFGSSCSCSSCDVDHSDP